MLADIGAPGQDAVNLADAPPAAVASEDTLAIEIFDDGLDAHLAGRAIALQREAVDEPDRVRVQRVDLQLLLDLRAALLGRDHAVADRRQRAVPEALTGILLQGAQDVLGVLLRLIFVEQGHVPPHHVVDRVVPKLLCDRNQLDAVLRQFAVIELHLELIAEEAREAMDHDDIEGGRLGRRRLDHALELRAAVVGGAVARLDEGFDELIAARLAIGFALSLLVGDRHVMLGLSHCRDAQIEGGAQRDIGIAEAGMMHVHSWPPAALRGRSVSGKSNSTRL
ncbi:MAG: hypothetical protein VB101_10300 [Rhodospirillaceae bacterium]|nr:hypothetical protein [Rhodospirillaceae bacterium]